jgi:DNA-binding winged helix-turn-helix (wHTH) protein/tetratricopeptide (TPR) repeat protein
MPGEQQLSFGPYRLDPAAGQLWRGTQEVKLTPKALAVLHLLLARPGRVVTKEELFQTVWSGTTVGDAALTSCIQELRQALHDDARKPRYVETVHRRGFRFIGAVQGPAPGIRRQEPESPPHPHPSAPTLVGRETELRQLHGWLEKALRGERQLVFVTGEPGIGKTTLVDAFLAQVAGERTVGIGRGQCIEHYGAGEAYLPLLEALGRLCRAHGGKPLVDLLAQHAPTWLMQLPSLMRPAELETLQRKVAGATKERMLRELAEALEALTTERPVILWLEDLHWGDYSTLDWLAFVARRQERARLFVLGTYRPVEVLTREHPLKAVKQELQVHGHCRELALDFLGEGDVTEYLARRFAVGAVREPSLRRVAQLIHQRTDGNPLFMINVVDSLVARGVLVQSDGRWELKGGVKEVEEGVPESLRQLIEQPIERVRPETQRMLEVASIAGAKFSAAAVAAGMETEVDVIEEQCEGLVRREQFLRAGGTIDWPDGTVAARYGFLHALYQDVLYHRLTARRRQRLHQRIGEREEAAYGDRVGEIAAELAMHFEQGRDYRRAVQYLQQAGENALHRSAHREALSLFTQGLELLKALPDTSERAQQELALQIILGRSLTATRGWAAPEVERAFARAQELCHQIGETPQLFPVLQGLCSYHLARGKLHAARELAEQLPRLAQKMSSQDYLLRACTLLGQTLYFLGEFASAREHLERGIALSDAQKHRLYIPPDTLQHFGVVCLCYVALALCALGCPDQALRRIHEALTLARDLDHPLSLVYALHHGALLHGWRREWSAVHTQAEATITVATERGFSYLLALGVFNRGWALVEQGHYEEGLAQLRQGVADSRAAGGTPVGFHGLLAEASGKVERPEEGLSILAQALVSVDKSGRRHYEAELYRLKGTLTLQSQVPSPKSKVEQEAEEYFLKAIEIARRQQAKSLELRAAMSLSRLWQSQGKKEEARKMLAEIYGWFTEGFDTADLKEAKALLEELA